MSMKTCTKCKIEKSIENFYNRSTSKDGKNCQCKECGERYRLEHLSEIKKYQQKYRSIPENKERQRECLKTPEFKAYLKEYGKLPKVVKKRQEYYQKPEVKIARKEYQNNWFQKPSGKIAKARYNHTRRIRNNNVECTLTLDQWNKIIDLQGNACIICHKAFTNKNPATKDHIIPLIEKGPFTFENTQAVHKSCNSKKHSKIDRSNIISWVMRPDLCITTESHSNC